MCKHPMEESGVRRGHIDSIAPASGEAPLLAAPLESEFRSLVEQIAAGAEPALGRLYDETSGIVFALAVRMLRRREDAEEVTLDTYTRAWRNASAYDPSRGSVIAWLVIMARSIAIDRIRARASKAGW